MKILSFLAMMGVSFVSFILSKSAGIEIAISYFVLGFFLSARIYFF
jgi:hypothetical protein